MRKLLLISTLLLSLISLFAQKGMENENFYDYTEEEIRDFCWNKSEYSKREVKIDSIAEGESAVYHYFVDFYECKKKGNHRFVSNLKMYKVQILDKSSLEDFSELYFIDEPVGTNYLAHKQGFYQGYRIVKSNGDIVESTPNDFFDEKEGKKIAVKNLQVGDILEYFTFTLYFYYNSSKNFYSIIQKYPISSSYPIHFFSCRVHTDENWKLFFRIPNVQEKIVQNRTNEKHENFSFTFEKHNVQKANPFYFNYLYQNYPYIKLYCHYSSVGIKNHVKNADKYFYERTIDQESVKEALNASDNYAEYGFLVNSYVKFSKFLKEKGVSDNISNSEQLREYYYYIRHYELNKNILPYYIQYGKWKDFSSSSLSLYMLFAMHKFNYKIYPHLTSFRSLGNLSDIISREELTLLYKLNSSSYYYPRIMNYTDRFERIPYLLEGADAYFLNTQKNVDTLTLPISNHEQNIFNYNTNFTISESNELQLKGQTSFSLHGHAIDQNVEKLVDLKKLIYLENDYYGTKKHGVLSECSKKEREKLEQMYNEQEQKLKENYEAFTKDLYNLEDVEMTSYKNISTGVFINDTVLESEIEYTLGGVVKKVGPNYVLSIGKLVGGQITLDEDDMQRDVDIHIDYPKTYRYAVNIAVPEGYEPVGLENLTNSINNEAGSLYSEASFANGTITMTFTKIYKKNYLPASDWDKMKEFLIPAADFTEKEVLLKKI